MSNKSITFTCCYADPDGKSCDKEVKNFVYCVEHIDDWQCEDFLNTCEGCGKVKECLLCSIYEHLSEIEIEDLEEDIKNKLNISFELVEEEEKKD